MEVVDSAAVETTMAVVVVVGVVGKTLETRTVAGEVEEEGEITPRLTALGETTTVIVGMAE